MKRAGYLTTAFLIGAVTAGSTPRSGPKPVVREEQNILVNGQKETWRLQWRTAPTQSCEPVDESLTCPCIGFAYGEAGDLFLVRFRDHREIERLRLTPLFTEQDSAVVQRWPADYDHDFALSKRADFSEIVAKRQPVQVMHFADYDHDGESSEFYLQTESLPCGQNAGIVVGVSKGNPHLHVFGPASKPNAPLYLQRREWDAVRDASSFPVQVIDWRCGDHAAETQTELELNWSRTGIDGVRREYTCPAKGKNRRLISQRPLSAAKQ